MRDGLRREIAAGTAPVFDHHLLAPYLGQPDGQNAGDGIGASAGRERHDQADESRGPSVRRRLREGGTGRDCQHRCGEPLRPSAAADHGVSPRVRSFDEKRPHSRMVMPASLMTGPHLSISVFRNVASSAGVELTTTTPSCSSRALVVGSFSAATVSAWIFAMTSGEVLAGAKNAYQEDTSKPGTPDSASGGRSGIAGVRLAVVTASPRSLPAWISGSTAPILLNITSTRPGIRSLRAGPAPRYGTCSISIRAMRLNSSPERWTEVPGPEEANVTLPLLALAKAMNSATERAGEVIGTAMILVYSHSSDTGARSSTAS